MVSGVVVSRFRVGRSTRCMGIPAGVIRVCTAIPTPLLFELLRAAVYLTGSNRGLSWAVLSVSIRDPKRGESHRAEHLPSDFIEESRELEFFLQEILPAFIFSPFHFIFVFIFIPFSVLGSTERLH